MSRVGITETKPTHDISLSDGINTVYLKLCNARGEPDSRAITSAGMPRTTLQVSQGSGGYSDLEYPYSAVPMEDWTGGRGAEDFEKDTTRFYDSNAVDTTRDGIILGPKVTYTSGYYGTDQTASGNADYALVGAKQIASAITPLAQLMIRKCRVWLKRTVGATYPFTLTVHLYSDSLGPSAEVAISSMRTITTLTAVYVAYDFEMSYTLVAGTKYWFVLEASAGGKATVWKASIATGNAIYAKTTGAWASEASNQAIAFTLYTIASGEAKFFEYKGALYAITAPDDFSEPKLFLNGYRGMALSNTAARNLLKTSLNLSGIDLTGCVIELTGGPGSTEENPTRKILSNTQTGTYDTITVDGENWKIEHTTATEYYISGTNTWAEVTGHGLTGPVTDVRVIDDIAYLAQGNVANMRRMKWATGNYTWADEGVKANLLTYIVNQTGKKYIWRTTTGSNQIYSAQVPTTWVNAVWGSAILAGSTNERVNGIVPYGQPTIPFILKEGSFGSIDVSVYAEAPISELASVKSIVNGRAYLRHDVYLYFNLRQGLERYYNGHLDDIGPNRDAGLPDERKGIIRHLLGYAGKIFACVDAGDTVTSYSSILVYNGLGWHEVYRAPGGKRIRRMHIQVVDGWAYDKLWFSEEEDLVWIPVVMGNPLKISGFPFAASGSVVTAWVYVQNLRDIRKFFKSVSVFSEGLISGHQSVIVEYQTDAEADASAWHSIGTYVTSPSEEKDFSATMNVSGYRARFRVSLASDDSGKTPWVKALIIKPARRVPPKEGWNLNFILEDQQIDLTGIQTGVGSQTVLDQLKKWADSDQYPCPILMRTNRPAYDNFYVFIDVPKTSPVGGNPELPKTERIMASMTVSEA